MSVLNSPKRQTDIKHICLSIGNIQTLEVLPHVGTLINFSVVWKKGAAEVAKSSLTERKIILPSLKDIDTLCCTAEAHELSKIKLTSAE